MTMDWKFTELEKGYIEVRGGQRLAYRIVQNPEGGCNGYIRFEKRPVREQGYDGILAYVAVHGGITYAESKDGGMEYGFDTMHYDSAKFPRDDKAWILGQIRLMAESIMVSAEVEPLYLRCLTNKGKAKHAQKVLDVAPKGTEMGFGAFLNLISGKV